MRFKFWQPTLTWTGETFPVPFLSSKWPLTIKTKATTASRSLLSSLTLPYLVTPQLPSHCALTENGLLSVSFWGYSLTKYSRGVRKEGLWLVPGVWATGSLCGALHRLQTWSQFKGDPRQTQLPEDKDHVQIFPSVGFAWLLCQYLCSRSVFLLQIWALQGANTLVHLLYQWRAEKGWLKYTSVTCSGCIRNVTDLVKTAALKTGFLWLKNVQGFCCCLQNGPQIALKLLWVLFILFLSIEPVTLL